MKIKNVSAKVIGVFGRDLMPDESMSCNEDMVKNLAVATMLKMGSLELDDSAEKQKALEEEIRQKILKEQEEAAAKAKAEADAAKAAKTAAKAAKEAAKAEKEKAEAEAEPAAE